VYGEVPPVLVEANVTVWPGVGDVVDALAVAARAPFTVRVTVDATAPIDESFTQTWTV
jgi:hypothetical protein